MITVYVNKEYSISHNNNNNNNVFIINRVMVDDYCNKLIYNYCQTKQLIHNNSYYYYYYIFINSNNNKRNRKLFIYL